MNKVCVLLAAYNGEKYLVEQIESILNQTEVDVDIYISLDLSTDGSYEIISEYAKLDNIHLLEYGARYGSAGQNFFNLLLSIDFSSYDYVSFSDQDDIWLDDKLKQSILSIKNENADAYSGNVTAFWSDGKQCLVKKDYSQTRYDYLFESSGPGCTFVLSNKLAIAIQLKLNSKKEQLNTLWLHDWFCYSFARANGFRWVIGSQPLMLYRQHENNEVGANSGAKAIISRAKVVLSGDAFDKVKAQADFLDQKEIPIQYINSGTLSSLVKLFFISFECRRKRSEKIFLSVAILLLSLKKILGVR
ncbi:glycosyltransferase [Photobacterium rosenbergii]|uniref:glycosyltransferase n=1 Tax=Photobacterium rosenbergii TaxID=294936 RepID=UPI001C99748B|nr:glycosyltransferase [Photobacterium rosenbergii]MBY5947434.1 glycosyltransferase [Photobacterium rosenbergii]